MKKLWLVCLLIMNSIEAHAESGACQLPSTLAGYNLFAKISGMDYKTAINAMSLRQLSFFDNRLINKSVITGDDFTAFYTYRRLSNDIAFIHVYQDIKLNSLLYVDVLFCETDIVGKLVFTPKMNISFDGFGKKQLTAKYILKKDAKQLNK